MNPYPIFWPMTAMAFLSLAILFLLPVYRFRAVRSRQVTADDFRCGESEHVPPQAKVVNRHLINTFETPVLFYVVCIALVIMRRADDLAVVLAWVYFALRLAHCAIHLTYNNVMHRLVAFGLSAVVLLVLWLRLAAALLATNP